MRVGIIGANGNVGRALANLCIKNSDSLGSLYFSDISPNFLGDSNETTIVNSKVIFLCVKPKEMDNVLRQIPKDKIVVSTAAGVSIKHIKEKIDSTNKVMRIMPNLPIIYGKGVITYFTNDGIYIDRLLRGPLLFRVEEERLLDISTILIGCMPAFIAQTSDIYLKFGENNGFTKEETIQLYTETVEGTMRMLKEGRNPEEIIKSVSSPGGVTEKAINFLNKSGLKNTISQSLEILK